MRLPRGVGHGRRVCHDRRLREPLSRSNNAVADSRPAFEQGPELAAVTLAFGFQQGMATRLDAILLTEDTFCAKSAQPDRPRRQAA